MITKKTPLMCLIISVPSQYFKQESQKQQQRHQSFKQKSNKYSYTILNPFISISRASQMSTQRIKIQLTPEYFRARFKILQQIHDPFCRSYFVASDSLSHKRAIYKHYLAETEEQLEAIYDMVLDIENYMKLSQQQGMCRILAYTRLVKQQQVLAAFQYHQLSLGEYILVQYKINRQTPEFIASSNKPMFYITFVQQLTTIIKSMSEIGIDLDQLNYGNILISNCQKPGNQVQLKMLYDEREKTYEKVLQGRVKTFTSGEKLTAMVGGGDEGYINQMGEGEDGMTSESVYQLGLMLIDMMHKCETTTTTTTTTMRSLSSQDDSFLVRDRPVVVIRSSTHHVDTQNSYYLFENGIITLNQDYLNTKLANLHNNPLRVIKQLSQLGELMIQAVGKRIRIHEVPGEIERIVKVYKDSLMVGKKNILPIQSPTHTKLLDSNNTMANTKQSLGEAQPMMMLTNRSSSLSINYGAENTQKEKPSLIPKDSILKNLKAHQSIRLSLQRLMSEIQTLPDVRRKQYYDGSVYYGSVNQSSNKRTGLGVYLYPSGDVYFGTWLQNQLVNGTYVFKNGQSYQGSVKTGKQGWGRYRYANGNVYEGEWKDDVKDGKGTMCYPNSDRYEGQWLRGKKNGLGKYFYNNGTCYEGNFINGRKQGLGTITFANGTKIEANWQQTHIQGEGKVSYANGDYFQGQYYMSEKHGKGLYVWSGDNTKYEGEFKKDALEGEARIYFTSKEYYSGRIKNGKRDGQGSYVYENGDSFTGEWKNDVKLIGTYRFNNGEEFEGKFKDNQLHFGVLRYGNGESYDGEFKNGCRHGIGSYRDRFKTLICEGHWQNDNFIQPEQYQWHA